METHRLPLQPGKSRTLGLSKVASQPLVILDHPFTHVSSLREILDEFFLPFVGVEGIELAWEGGEGNRPTIGRGAWTAGESPDYFTTVYGTPLLEETPWRDRKGNPLFMEVYPGGGTGRGRTETSPIYWDEGEDFVGVIVGRIPPKELGAGATLLDIGGSWSLSDSVLLWLTATSQSGWPDTNTVNLATWDYSSSMKNVTGTPGDVTPSALFVGVFMWERATDTLHVYTPGGTNSRDAYKNLPIGFDGVGIGCGSDGTWGLSGGAIQKVVAAHGVGLATRFIEGTYSLCDVLLSKVTGIEPETGPRGTFTRDSSATAYNVRGSSVLDDGEIGDPTLTSWTAINNAILTREIDPVEGSPFLRVTGDGTDSPGARQSKGVAGPYYLIKGKTKSDGKTFPRVMSGSRVIWEGPPWKVWKTIDIITTLEDGEVTFGHGGTTGSSEFKELSIKKCYLDLYSPNTPMAGGELGHFSEHGYTNYVYNNVLFEETDVTPWVGDDASVPVSYSDLAALDVAGLGLLGPNVFRYNNASGGTRYIFCGVATGGVLSYPLSVYARYLGGSGAELGWWDTVATSFTSVGAVKDSYLRTISNYPIPPSTTCIFCLAIPNGCDLLWTGAQRGSAMAFGAGVAAEMSLVINTLSVAAAEKLRDVLSFRESPVGAAGGVRFNYRTLSLRKPIEDGVPIENDQSKEISSWPLNSSTFLLGGYGGIYGGDSLGGQWSVQLEQPRRGIADTIGRVWGNQGSYVFVNERGHPALPFSGSFGSSVTSLGGTPPSGQPWAGVRGYFKGLRFFDRKGLLFTKRQEPVKLDVDFLVSDYILIQMALSPLGRVMGTWGNGHAITCIADGTLKDIERTYTAPPASPLNVGGDLHFITDLRIVNQSNISGGIDWLSSLSSLTNLDLHGTPVSTYNRQDLPEWDGVTLDLHDTALTSEAIDNLLLDLAESGSVNGVLDIAGTNECRTSASDEALSDLLAAGWTIDVWNPCPTFTNNQETLTTTEIRILCPVGGSLTLDWGDGYYQAVTCNGVQQNITYDYSSTGTYRIRLLGTVELVTRFYCPFRTPRQVFISCSPEEAFTGFRDITHFELGDLRYDGPLPSLEGKDSLSQFNLRKDQQEEGSVTGDLSVFEGRDTLTFLSADYMPGLTGDIARLGGLPLGIIVSFPLRKRIQLGYKNQQPLPIQGIYGDISSTLPNSDLWGIDLSGREVSGDLAHFSSGDFPIFAWAGFESCPGIYGDISTFKTDLGYLYLSGTGVTGDLSTLPSGTGASAVSLGGTAVTGDLSDLSSRTGLTVVDVSNTAVTGSVTSLTMHPTSHDSLYINDTTITGTTSNLGALVHLQTLDFSNTPVTGDIAALATLTKMKVLNGSGCSLSYTSTTLPNWPEWKPGLGIDIDFSSTGLSSTEVDDFLIDLADSGTINGTLNIAGTNASRTSASNAAIATLIAAGWTLDYNSRPIVINDQSTLSTTEFRIYCPVGGSLTVDWGDGSSDNVTCNGARQNLIHNYSSTGTYNIRLLGTTEVITRFEIPMRTPRQAFLSVILEDFVCRFRDISHLEMMEPWFVGDLSSFEGYQGSGYLRLFNVDQPKRTLAGDISVFEGKDTLTQVELFSYPEITGDIAVFAGNPLVVFNDIGVYPTDKTLPESSRSLITGNLTSFVPSAALWAITNPRTSICGDIGHFSSVEDFPTLDYIGLGEALYVYGDIAALSRMQWVYLNGTGVTGTLSSFSSNTRLSIFQVGGTAVIGDLSNLSACTNLAHLDVSGTAIIGSLASITMKSSYQYLLKINDTAITGTTSNLGAFIHLRILDFSNTPVTGDIAALAPLTKLVDLNGSGCNLSYTSTPLPAWPGASINLSSTGLSSTEVDDFLIDLADGVGSNGTLKIGGTNASRTSASTAARTALLAAGWTIDID